MGKCLVCERSVFDSNGCLDNLYFKKDHKYIDRKTNDSEESCVMCNCLPGSYHHGGCEYEKCPICSEGIFDCKCTEKSLFQIHKI